MSSGLGEFPKEIARAWHTAWWSCGMGGRQADRARWANGSRRGRDSTPSLPRTPSRLSRAPDLSADPNSRAGHAADSFCPSKAHSIVAAIGPKCPKWQRRRFGSAAFGWSYFPHSFHGEVFSSARLLLSISLVQLCAAHTPKPRRARFRALRLRYAPEIDSASLCLFPRQL